MIEFGDIPEPQNLTEDTAPSTTGIPKIIWRYIQPQLKGLMTWQEWLHFTDRHGDEIYAFEPSHCGCIKRWAKGELSWKDLLKHLEEKLNERIGND